MNRLTIYLKNNLKEKHFHTTCSYKDVNKKDVVGILSGHIYKDIIKAEYNHAILKLEVNAKKEVILK